ncbi:hypothetical protein B7P43_G17350 [Cryptotermes secundus]|uniref:Uncharacterized protein n=1 Tax=Cryptotermes secundus TaxID=105785 RepID=A0A2J7PNV2_9NEOP|nr:hypothetical protein B7P43_G17350 [Cryptotermes secundus]
MQLLFFLLFKAVMRMRQKRYEHGVHNEEHHCAPILSKDLKTNITDLNRHFKSISGQSMPKDQHLHNQNNFTSFYAIRGKAETHQVDTQQVSELRRCCVPT